MSKNAITYALAAIRRDIPRAVLELTFNKPLSNKYAVPVSIDSRIREEVIENRCLTDLNIVSGTEITISLRNADCEYIQPGVYVYRIPPRLTQHRQITTALSVAFAERMYGAIAYPASGSEIDGAMLQQSRGLSSVPYVSDARCSVIGNNVVMVEHPDMGIGTMDLYLRCIVENDANLNHLHRTSWLDFAKLCVLAAKAEVYTRNVIDVDSAYVHGGQVLGAYKDIIDEYRDANETYDDFLRNKMTKVMMMNDNEQHSRFIKLTSMGL